MLFWQVMTVTLFELKIKDMWLLAIEEFHIETMEQ